MPFTLPAIYPITDALISGVSHFEQVRRLIGGGARLIQIREKNAPAGEWYADAARAMRTARECGVRLLINDRADLAIAIGANGVHLGQDDLPPEAARKLLGPDAIIGVSTHTLEQVRLAARLPVDYIAFGPVFSTKTKNDTEPAVGIELLSEARLWTGRIPLVAIGGINASNLAYVLAAGADSAALIGAVISDVSEIEGRMSELVRIADLHC